jgi:acyl carrier protein
MVPDIRETVLEILSRQSGKPVAAIRADATLDSLGIDSLGKAEVIFAVEEAFDIEVPFNANDPTASPLDLSNVGAALDAVERLVGARGAD